MAVRKVAITMDRDLLERLDRLVDERFFTNRSRAIQQAVEEKLQRLNRTRLAREAAKLDRACEQELADETLSGEVAEWPEY